MTKDLTEQWKNGELEGEYYIETNDGKHYVCELQTKSGVKNKLLPLAKSFNGYVSNKSVAKVLAPVPSYEEYSRLEWYAGCGPDRIVELNKENRKLKELLKECKGLFNRATVDGAEPNNAELITILNKIDEVLNVAED